MVLNFDYKMKWNQGRKNFYRSVNVWWTQRLNSVYKLQLEKTAASTWDKTHALPAACTGMIALLKQENDYFSLKV